VWVLKLGRLAERELFNVKKESATKFLQMEKEYIHT
jgi:hypothetical protein